MLARLAAGPLQGACDGTAQGLPSPPEHGSGDRERCPTELALSLPLLPPLTRPGFAVASAPGVGSSHPGALGSVVDAVGCQWGL